MSNQRKVDYLQLEPGYEVPPASCTLNASTVSTYLEAVGETDSLYQDTELVPPMAVAALAMAALSEGIQLPPGAIHISQEIDFMDTVLLDDTITSRAKVGGKRSRGQFCLLTIDLDVCNQKGKAVLAGKTSFLVP